MGIRFKENPPIRFMRTRFALEKEETSCKVSRTRVSKSFSYMKSKLVSKLLVVFFFGMVSSGAAASERTILLGPKTIGPGWKDNIVIQPQQFQAVSAGDIVTVYATDYKRTAQVAFQDPKDWQAIAPEYAYVGISGPVKMKVTDDMVPRLRERGLCLGGHDYRIAQVTLIPAAEMTETIIYKGPAMTLKDDWSTTVDIQKKTFRDVQVGDGLRFYVSKVKPGAAIKLMDFTWQPMDKSVDGAPVGGDQFTYYIYEQSQLVRLGLAGPDGVVMKVGGKGFRFEKIAIVRCTAQPDEDYSTAQRAPKEYKLQPGELFHGEREFGMDWSANLRLSAEPFQECTENDVIIVSYHLLPGATEAKMSFRENKGKWHDISGTAEPQWQTLNGTDVVLTFDAASLDKLKTSGLVVTGAGFVLDRIELVSAQ